MIEIKIDVTEMGLTLDHLTRGIEDREEIHKTAAGAVEEAWRQHLLDNYVTEENEENPGVTYWADVRDSMENKASSDGGLVSVKQQFIEDYYYGVTWTPGKSISSYTQKLTRALAKPTIRVGTTRGRRNPPAEEGPLAFVRATEGNLVGYLYEGTVTGKISRGRNKGKDRVKKTGPLMYTLLSSETIRPDPGIIPADDDLAKAARTALLDLITAGI